MRTWSFAKGHGTANDFVIVSDRHDLIPLADEDVRALCNRRTGIGGDGLLRVTLASSIDSWRGDPEMWFMDYRNADGSIAEMCGNGLRVFARYLIEEGLVDELESFPVATRAGVRTVWPQLDGRIRAGMGPVTIGQEPVEVTCRLRDEEVGHWQATTVDVGNPHAVCLLGPGESLDELDLRAEPQWSPAEAFPAGTNVEFVVQLGERHIGMRVHERGSGETMSCGTGTVAAAAAWARSQDVDGGTIRVDVPGGTLEVELGEREAWLTGPAVVVARGEVLLPERAQHAGAEATDEAARRATGEIGGAPAEPVRGFVDNDSTQPSQPQE